MMSSILKPPQSSLLPTCLLIFVVLSVLPATESVNMSAAISFPESTNSSQLVSGGLMMFFLGNSAVNWPVVQALPARQGSALPDEKELSTTSNSTSTGDNCSSTAQARFGGLDWLGAFETVGIVVVVVVVIIVCLLWPSDEGSAEKNQIAVENTQKETLDLVATRNDLAEIRIKLENLLGEIRNVTRKQAGAQIV